MSAISNFWKRINRTTLYSAKNPDNFNQKWGLRTTPFRMFSLILVVVGLIVFLSAYFLGPMFSSSVVENSSMKNEIKRMSELETQLAEQEQYINDIKTVLSGGHVGFIQNDTIENVSSLNADSIDNSVSPAEKSLANEVERDLTFSERVASSSLTYFATPIDGVISQEYSKDHCAVDIVAKENSPFRSCLQGTIIYKGYSVNDGNIIIVNHPNNYLSVYKHAKTVFKKVGDKVDIGDPLGIIGNTGENSSGPHLHFELWQDQKSVNPAEFMSF